MSYQLSEAYENLYNPRVESFVDDNLRFIDFMEDEDIEEVVESVYWELRDYGSPLDEAVGILSMATTTDVISETYEEILLEFDMSAEDSAKLARKASKGKGLKFAKSVADKQRQAARSARIQHAVTKVRKRVDGPIARAKAAFKGAQGGMGTAKKAFSQAAQDGKAKLGKLLRRGVSLVAQGVRSTGRAIGSAGKAMERRGAAATQSGLQSRQAGRVGSGGQMELAFEPTTKEKAGGSASRIGQAIRKAGAIIARTPSKIKTELKGGKNQAKLAQMKAARAARASSTPDTSAMGSVPTGKGTDFSKPSSLRKKSYGVGKQQTASGKPYSKLTPKQAAQYGAQQPVARKRKDAGPARRRVSPGTTGERGMKKDRGGATYDALGRRLREDYDVVIEQLAQDLISEGYTDNFDSALNIIDNLSEDVFNELIADYLD
jgi:hypothetical protein